VDTTTASWCATVTDEDDELAREILSGIADKWALWILHALKKDGTLRFARLREKIEGISQKMLTKTLRRLERDGFVTRVIFPEVPPRVEYTLTEMGSELEQSMEPLWRWIVLRAPTIRKSRQEFH